MFIILFFFHLLLFAFIVVRKNALIFHCVTVVIDDVSGMHQRPDSRPSTRPQFRCGENRERRGIDGIWPSPGSYGRNTAKHITPAGQNGNNNDEVKKMHNF